MTKDDVYAAVKDTLCEHFEIPEEQISLQADLVEDLDIDSIDAVDLIVRMRQRTGVRVDPKSFRSVRTVGDVVDALAQLLDARE